MKNLSTGTGIALLAGAIVAYPILDRVMPKADASATHAASVVAAATAQAVPTVVWYGVSEPDTYGPKKGGIFRAWSDGKIEVKEFQHSYGNSNCSESLVYSCGWQVFSSANQGYSSAADINFDSKVDGADLGQLLTAWGDAPRHDIPSSDCPLDMINP
jgi:hypothetical protein